MKPEILLQYSKQALTTGLYPEPHASSQQLPTLFPEDPF
jgi:hypothetical protein